MECMLLSDGTVKAFSSLPLYEDVLEALADYDGIAHYWYSTAYGWGCIKPEHREWSDTKISASDVPDVIKLALMME